MTISNKVLQDLIEAGPPYAFCTVETLIEIATELLRLRAQVEAMTAALQTVAETAICLRRETTDGFEWPQKEVFHDAVGRLE
jgi:hypothetical protein